jgi:hypothetical protein
MSEGFTGGCQCGAVRFRAQSLGRASICHCRMCQKAFGSFFGPLVDANGLEWTRGAPAYFQSSNRVRRGFCAACGTPLSFESERWAPNIAIGAFDDPAAIVPAIQVGLEAKLPYVDGLADLRHRSAEASAKMAEIYDATVSRQHPDHDTEAWPPEG